ncbi:MAG: hypothetical protein GXP31_19460 [Kiritimatiellaeota bacterium]|nr:hypothetical protein [Kiritimatiellota bacterium]
MLFYGSARTYDPSAHTAAAGARSEARRAQTKAESLQLDVERLLMITEALWTIMKEEHGYSDDQLIEKVSEIDMRDGRLDGQVKAAGVLKCPSCGRTLMKHRPVCLYCGAAVAVSPFQR